MQGARRKNPSLSLFPLHPFALCLSFIFFQIVLSSLAIPLFFRQTFFSFASFLILLSLCRSLYLLHYPLASLVPSHPGLHPPFSLWLVPLPFKISCETRTYTKEEKHCSLHIFWFLEGRPFPREPLNVGCTI